MNNNNLLGYLFLRVLLTIVSAIVTGLASLTSATNSTISIGKSSESIFDAVEEHYGISEDDSYINSIILLATLGIAFYAVSVFYQRIIKNFHKADETTTRPIKKCLNKKHINNTDEEILLSVNDDIEEHTDDEFLGAISEGVTVYKKPQRSIWRRGNSFLAFLAEIGLGVASTATLIKTIVTYYTGNPDELDWLVYTGGTVCGLSAAAIFYIVNLYQSNHYDQAALLSQRLDNINSLTLRKGTKAALAIGRHVAVDVAILAAELGDFTTFEVILDTLLGVDDFWLNLTPIIACFFIGMSKYPNYHDKFAGLLFRLTGGKIYELEPESEKNEEEVKCNAKQGVKLLKQIIGGTTYGATIIGTLTKNTTATFYQAYKATSNFYFAMFCAGFAGINSSLMTAALLHDLPKVDIKLQEEVPIEKEKLLSWLPCNKDSEEEAKQEQLNSIAW